VVTSIPFELRGLDGRVDVEYLVNEDPARWGYPLLGLGSLPDHARGCPVARATVTYPAEGYAALMGWIQVVEHGPEPSGELAAIVDVAPQIQAVEDSMPYMSFGVRPAFFDAPATDVDTYEFRARAFLAASPDALMTPVVGPLCGFTWGYAIEGGERRITPLERAGGEEWSWMRAVLARDCPGWEFLELGWEAARS
jgi:hypothetical protein